LLEIDYVNAIALCENIALHFWIQTTRLVSEVDSAVEKFSHCYYGHDGTLLLRFFAHAATNKPDSVLVNQFDSPVALEFIDQFLGPR
jgi:hypothetical protein